MLMSMCSGLEGSLEGPEVSAGRISSACLVAPTLVTRWCVFVCVCVCSCQIAVFQQRSLMIFVLAAATLTTADSKVTLA